MLVDSFLMTNGWLLFGCSNNSKVTLCFTEKFPAEFNEMDNLEKSSFKWLSKDCLKII